jgi:hypothetical protein
MRIDTVWIPEAERRNGAKVAYLGRCTMLAVVARLHLLHDGFGYARASRAAEEVDRPDTNADECPSENPSN